MIGKPYDPLKKCFEPQKRRELRNAVAECIQEEFPKFGGERLCLAMADMIVETIRHHEKDAKTISHGKVLWAAISRDHPPARNRRTRNQHLIGVVLTLSCSEDVDERIARKSPRERLRNRAIRLCREAYEQGALLSNADLAEMLNTSDSSVATVLQEYERETGVVVPRRATLHDVGSGLTHKDIICRKRYVEGKASHEIAIETCHSIEAVDRYLGMFDRVRHCRQHGMSIEATAVTLQCGLSLVQQYLAIDDELKKETDSNDSANHENL